MSLHFDELLRKRLEKVVHFVKKHEKSWIWWKLATFRTKYHVFTFRWTFRQTVAKTASFREKARKLIDLAKTMKVFRTNYHVLVFRWTFQQKVANSGSFLGKERKIIDLAKTCNFSRKQPCFGVLVSFSPKSCKKWLISSRSTKNHRFPQNLQLFDETTMFRRFGHFFRKKLQKRAHFVKKHEKSSIWPKLATLRGNYDVSEFWSIFQQKVGESGSFREKERNIIDLAKSCNFSSKLPCFRVLVNFSAKTWKKWLISWKMTKNHRFGLNLQLFEETTMFQRFCRLFRKNVQKVAHFVKEHEKWSIWPKLATFRANYHVSAFWWTFEQKVSHFVKKHEKSSIWPKLTTSRTNYHVSAFWSAFQQKVVKSIVGAYQAQAIIAGFATSICSFHLCRDWGNDFWNYVSRSTGVLG